MKKIAIIGAGGFGREIKVLIDEINKINPCYELIGFFDDSNALDIVNGIPVLGSIEKLTNDFSNINLSICFGIGNPIVKHEMIQKLKKYKFDYPILIHPKALISQDDVSIGEGTVICAGTIITCNIKIGDFVTFNLLCSVGHDTIINDFCSFMPGVNISGEVLIGEKVYIGTGAKVINQLKIGSETIIGAGAVVSKTLESKCTAVGVPAKPIKYN